MVVVGMLEGLKDLPSTQKSFLERLLFGGMGSFLDFTFDQRVYGDRAKPANEQLARIRTALFGEFRKL